MNVADELQEIAVRRHQHGVVPAFEEVARRGDVPLNKSRVACRDFSRQAGSGFTFPPKPVEPLIVSTRTYLIDRRNYI